MEFDFTSLAFGGEQHIVAWDAKKIGTLKPDDVQNLAKLLDVFGKKSAIAQGLQNPITDIHRLRTTDQRIYLYMYRQSSKTVVLGGLKVGSKRLYVRTITADLKEIEPTCVLDFYVHESCQRQGVGKALFEHFLNTEGRDPACIAYDRPSPKLLAFLQKHYGLHEYVPQSNNFVVFNRYFELSPTSMSSSRGGSQAQRLNSRGSVVSSVGTPHIHPLHGPRSTPPPQALGPLQPVHPGWAGVAGGGLVVPSPSAVGPPPPLGQSPSFGQRWAASTFGSTPPPYAISSPAAGQEVPIGAGTASSSGSGYGVVGVQAGTGGCESGHHHGDSLDVFSRAQYGAGQQQQQPGRLTAPWEASSSQGGWPPGGPSGSGGQPSASRGSGSAYASRPPWAVDDVVGAAGVGTGNSSGPAAAGGVSPPLTAAPVYSNSPARTPPPIERLGTGPPRSPLQAILSGGFGVSGSSGGPGCGPHTLALQQQLAAMQRPDGATDGQAAGSAQGGYGAAGPAQQPWSGGVDTPGAGGRGATGLEESTVGGRGAARIMAVAQRSGAGAADCLVW